MSSGDTRYSSVAVSYDYSTDDKSASSNKLPMFNGDHDTISCWKTKIGGIFLWDILEDGVNDIILDEEGVVVDRKKNIAA